MNTSHLDPQLVDKIVHEVKSQGVFDDFRKDTLSDVDTKPAYQNLRHRVESSVKKFLSDQKWTPETNKYHLREKLRRHITESGFLDVGVERIVDQVVNPKIGSVFQPRIEEIAYKYLGIPPPPPVKNEPPPPPMIHPLPPLPLNGSGLKVETSNLLPTDLEQVSPDSDKATIKSEFKEDSLMDMDVDEKLDEDDESPPFEPLVRCTSPISHDHNDNYDAFSDGPPGVDSPRKSEVSQQAIEDTVIQSGAGVGIMDAETQDTSMSVNTLEMDSEKEASRSLDYVAAQESQLSQVSSDTNSSTQSAGVSKSPANESAAVNISEEAQMPKFNDNSSEANEERNASTSQLHFDIKKDEIKFEGTERKSSLIPPCSINSIKDEPYVEHDTEKHDVAVKVEKQIDPNNGSHHGLSDEAPLKDADNCFKFEKVKDEIEAETAVLATHMQTEMETEVDVEAEAETSLTPIPDQSCCSSQDETYSAQHSNSDKPITDLALSDDRKLLKAIESTLQMEHNQDGLSLKQKEDKDSGKSSSCSFRHKKHAKDKHRSHEKDKDKDKEREKERDRDRERNKDRDRDRNKDKNRERERERERGRDKERDRDRNKERDREKHRSGDRDRSHDKYGRSKHSSSSSSKLSNSNIKSTSTEASHKSDKTSGSTKPTTIQLSNSSSSSSRSEVSSLSTEAKRSDRRNENNKKEKSLLSTSANSTKKGNGEEKTSAEQTIDDHNASRERTVRKKSTDSNDDDKSPEAGTQSNANATIATSNGKNTTTTKQTQKQQQQQQNSTESNTKCAQNSQQSQLANKLLASKVVILNDILENPATNFIELEAANSHTNHVQIITSTSSGRGTTTMLPTTDASSSVEDVKLRSTAEPASDTKDELLFFDGATDQFLERLTLLNKAIADCRWLINSLSIGTDFSDQNILHNAVTSHTKEAETNALLLTDSMQCNNNNNNKNKNNSKIKYNNNNAEETVNVEKNLYTPLCKRFKHNTDGALNTNETSPTPSDMSANSKENETFDKNVVTQKISLVSSKKLSQQQRYTSEDLYKPRPILSQRTRRRDLDAML